MSSAARPITPRLVVKALREVRVGQILSFSRSYMMQELEIARQNRSGEVLPTAMHIELTTFCPGRCWKCYVPQNEKKEHSVIDLATARRAVAKGREWGIRIFNFMGGETVTQKTIPVIESLTRENPSVTFFACTNSDLLSTQDRRLDSLAMRDNLTFVLSVNGFERTNDTMRGKWAFKRVELAAEYLKARRCFFGALPTVWKENADEVTSERFLDYLVSKGFVHVYYAPAEDGLLSYFQQVADVARRKPIFVYVSNMGPALRDMAHVNRTRTVYVTKDGRYLNDRRERMEISGADGSVGDYRGRSEWTKKFKD